MLEEIFEGGDSEEAYVMDHQEHIQKMLDRFEKGIYIYIYIYIY